MLLAATGGLLLLPATTASAHPLGNFTVNYYEGLHLNPDRIDVSTVTDSAELPTYQTISPAVDSGGHPSPAKKAAYTQQACHHLADGLKLTVDGVRTPLQVRTGGLAFLPSTALRGLFTSRLNCDLSAPADLTRKATVSFSDHVDDRYGWHEITATGAGVHLTDSAAGASGQPIAATSISDELRHYPNNLLSSPLAIRDVRFTTRPGAGAAAAGRYSVSGTNSLQRALEPLTNAFFHTAASRDVTLPVGLLALALAVALGCGHAALPGHGKTVMAAYLIGRRGSVKDALVVGATVTLTHTAGVLLLGLAITLSAQYVGTDTLRYLGVASGLLVAAIGTSLLRTALANRRATTRRCESLPATVPELVGVGAGAAGSASTTAAAGRHDSRDGHVHDGAHHHEHDHQHGHDHQHHDGPIFTRRGLIGMGVAGGLVPSPSALVVLLSAAALGRTLFGIALVAGYGLGMAATLLTAGLLLVRLRDRIDRHTRDSRLRLGRRYLQALPVLTATLVLLVGLALALRAFTSAG